MDFDSQFTKTERMVNRTFGLVVVVQIIFAILGLGVMGGLGYIAWHFVQKVW